LFSQLPVRRRQRGSSTLKALLEPFLLTKNQAGRYASLPPFANMLDPD
jgi:hypothetical protein